MKLRSIFLWMYFSNVGMSQFLSPPFHRTFSHGCTEANINNEDDCAIVAGKLQWSVPKRTAESATRFDTIGNKPEKCYYKQIVQEQKCNSVPSCVMTLYKYNLPRAPRNVDATKCARSWSVETACKANGPGGRNTKAVYSECFTRGVRSYCDIKFEKCTPQKCFTWTSFKRQCYVPCSNPAYTGVAMKVIRQCKECGGGFVDENNCKGGKEAATQIRRCLRKSKAKQNFPDCLIDTSATTNTPKVTTNSVITTKDASQMSLSTKANARAIESVATTARTKPQPKTTELTSPSVSVSSNAQSVTSRSDRTSAGIYIPVSTTSSNTDYVNTKLTETVVSFTKVTVGSSILGDKRYSNDGSSIIPITEKEITPPLASTTQPKEFSGVLDNARALLPDLNLATTRPKGNDTLSSGFSDGYNEGTSIVTFDLVTIASGAGAGLLLVFIIIAVIIVLLSRRRNTKSSSISNVSSSSSYKTRSSRNPVVDSSSFRIATWIRERPALPNGGRRSSSESVVSDAEYWKIGQSGDDSTVRYASSDPQSESSEEIPDVVRVRSSRFGEEHIYDELSFSESEEIQSSPPRPTPHKTRHTSAISSQSEPSDVKTDWPIDKSVVYAVVQKARKQEQKNARKRSSTSSTNDLRKRIASNRSVTHLNGRHLREGVLQIEFDEEEGIKCKLSESDVYINLDESESPTAV